MRRFRVVPDFATGKREESHPPNGKAAFAHASMRKTVYLIRHRTVVSCPASVVLGEDWDGLGWVGLGLVRWPSGRESLPKSNTQLSGNAQNAHSIKLALHLGGIEREDKTPTRIPDSKQIPLPTPFPSLAIFVLIERNLFFRALFFLQSISRHALPCPVVCAFCARSACVYFRLVFRRAVQC